jgi:hypothetical protein
MGFWIGNWIYCTFTIRDYGFWIGNWIYWTLRFMITIYSGTIANSHSLQFSLSSLFSLTSDLVPGSSGAHSPFLGSETVPVPQP